jgi:hypothetical protein
VSGSFTKHGGTLWCGDRPDQGWEGSDLTQLVAEVEGPGLRIDPTLQGEVRIVGHTVDRRIDRAIAVCEADGTRSIAMSSEPPWLERFETEDRVETTVRIAEDGQILS